MFQATIIVRMWTLNDKHAIQEVQQGIDLTIRVSYLKYVFLLFIILHMSRNTSLGLKQLKLCFLLAN